MWKTRMSICYSFCYITKHIVIFTWTVSRWTERQVEQDTGWYSSAHLNNWAYGSMGMWCASLMLTSLTKWLLQTKTRLEMTQGKPTVLMAEVNWQFLEISGKYLKFTLGGFPRMESDGDCLNTLSQFLSPLIGRISIGLILCLCLHYECNTNKS